MNGKKARLLRLEVYGKDFASNAAGRQYKIKRGKDESGKEMFWGTVFADPKRRQYKRLKKLYIKGASIG